MSQEQRITLQEQLIAFVESHGFAVAAHGPDHIAITIPYSREGRISGEQVFLCPLSVRQVKETIGY